MAKLGSASRRSALKSLALALTGVPAAPAAVAAPAVPAASAAAVSTSAAISSNILAPVTRLPVYRLPTGYSQNFQPGHGWVASGAGVASSNMNDTSQFVRGTQCATVTTTGTGVQSGIQRLNQAPFGLAGTAVRIVLKVDDVTNLSRITFYVGTGSLANYYYFRFHTHSANSANYIQSGEWVTVTFQTADVNGAAGTYTIGPGGQLSTSSGFTDMKLAVYDNGAGPVTYHLNAVEFIPGTNLFNTNHGVASIVFDDSYAGVYTLARPVMEPLGYRGTMYTIVETIDSNSTYLTLDQLRAFQDFNGWEIGGHSYTLAAHNAGFNTLTSVEVDQEMYETRAWMVSNGFSGDSFAYPSGRFDATTDGVPVDRICSQYFSTGRSIISETSEVAPRPTMPYRVKALTGINDGTGLGGTTVANLTTAGGLIERCYNEGTWLVLVFHEITSGAPASSTQCSQAGFQAVMNKIQSTGITVLPVADVLRYP